MEYSSGGDVTKLQFASYLAASLSYMMIKQQDAVGLVALTNRSTRISPMRHPVIFVRFLLLESARPGTGLALQNHSIDSIGSRDAG